MKLMYFLCLFSQSEDKLQHVVFVESLDESLDHKVVDINLQISIGELKSIQKTEFDSILRISVMDIQGTKSSLQLEPELLSTLFKVTTKAATTTTVAKGNFDTVTLLARRLSVHYIFQDKVR